MPSAVHPSPFRFQPTAPPQPKTSRSPSSLSWSRLEGAQKLIECGTVLRSRVSYFRINPQHFHELAHFAEMPECVAGGFIVAAQKVDIEHILPRTPAHGP